MGRANQAAQKTAVDAIARIHTPALSLTGTVNPLGSASFRQRLIVIACPKVGTLTLAPHGQTPAAPTSLSGTLSLRPQSPQANSIGMANAALTKHYVRHDAEQPADALGWT